MKLSETRHGMFIVALLFSFLFVFFVLVIKVYQCRHPMAIFPASMQLHVLALELFSTIFCRSPLSGHIFVEYSVVSHF